MKKYLVAAKLKFASCYHSGYEFEVYAKTKTDAIHQAASELIRRKKLDQLKSLSGKIRLDLDWEKLEQAEIRHHASLRRRRHGHR